MWQLTPSPQRLSSVKVDHQISRSAISSTESWLLVSGEQAVTCLSWTLAGDLSVRSKAPLQSTASSLLVWNHFGSNLVAVGSAENEATVLVLPDLAVSSWNPFFGSSCDVGTVQFRLGHVSANCYVIWELRAGMNLLQWSIDKTSVSVCRSGKTRPKFPSLSRTKQNLAPQDFCISLDGWCCVVSEEGILEGTPHRARLLSFLVFISNRAHLLLCVQFIANLRPVEGRLSWLRCPQRWNRLNWTFNTAVSCGRHTRHPRSSTLTLSCTHTRNDGKGRNCSLAFFFRSTLLF